MVDIERNVNNVLVHLTMVNGEEVSVFYGRDSRCDNCGKTTREARDIITGGEICEGEWACCKECENEMLKKGCAFEELGDMTYRKQKY